MCSIHRQLELNDHQISHTLIQELESLVNILQIVNQNI